jgi:hypothetical protein
MIEGVTVRTYETKIKVSGNIIELREYHVEQLRDRKSNGSKIESRYECIFSKEYNHNIIIDKFTSRRFLSIIEFKDYVNANKQFDGLTYQTLR